MRHSENRWSSAPLTAMRFSPPSVRTTSVNGVSLLTVIERDPAALFPATRLTVRE